VSRQCQSWIIRRAIGTHPLASPHKSFAMLQAYIDDSGSHDKAHNCLLGGYWGGVNEWRKFERKWKAVLDHFGIEEFHAKEFWPRPNGFRIGPYKRWSNDRHRSLIDNLLKVIQSSKIYPFMCGVLSAEWEKQQLFYREIFTGASRLKPNINQKHMNPLFLPFQVCVARLSQYCHPGVTMNFVVDQTSFPSAWVDCFRGVKYEMFAEDKLRQSIGELTFADSKIALPLQAADLLAYEGHRYGKQSHAKGDANFPMRDEYRRALCRFRTKDDFWLFDGPRFRTLINNLEMTKTKV
jgi:hypothetical protein